MNIEKNRILIESQLFLSAESALWQLENFLSNSIENVPFKKSVI